jgi:anti-sigma-K factor RskA
MSAHEQYRDDLALYAVGALSSEESARLELHLAECSTCREELNSLSEAAAQIALAVEPTVPSAHFRAELMARLEEQRSVAVAPRDGRLPVAGRQYQRRRAWFWAPALATLAFALAFVAVWRQNRTLTGENRDLAARLATSRQTLDRAGELIRALTAPDAQHVSLVAAGAKVQPEAKVVYSSRQHSLVLLADHLNPLPAHKIYELWLLPANGSPALPAGTFKPDDRGSAALVLSQLGDGVAAKGFAVTVENEPGSAVPTMPIVLSGTT